MGKQGPCHHCGATSTPLWRNGPPEKPVLCNACGSRWRTKGTLANYFPLHARADSDGYEDPRVSRFKNVSVNKNKEMKILKRKSSPDYEMVKRAVLDLSQGSSKAMDEDISNRSSSGSVVSNSESCAQLWSGETSDLTGGIPGESSAQSNALDALVPLKKTYLGRLKPSPVEKLRKDLYTILQEQQNSFFSGSSEEDLLLESETTMVSVETGHGSVLMRHPHRSGREEKSVGSSLLADRKNSFSDAYSHSARIFRRNHEKVLKLPVHGGGKDVNFAQLGILQEQLTRGKSRNENSKVVGGHCSPLCSIDLKDILNFKEFVGQFTIEEQQQLMKLLLPRDTFEFPDSLRDMFDSIQFQENLSFFQRLIVEGVFDASEGEPEDFKHLRKLALTDMNMSNLVGSYQIKNTSILKNTAVIKRMWENQDNVYSEAKTKIKRSKSIITTKLDHQTAGAETYNDHSCSCFNPKTLFAFPPEGTSEMSGYEDSNQDLILQIPSNGSFPQSELLHQL